MVTRTPSRFRVASFPNEREEHNDHQGYQNHGWTVAGIGNCDKHELQRWILESVRTLYWLHQRLGLTCVWDIAVGQFLSLSGCDVTDTGIVNGMNRVACSWSCAVITVVFIKVACHQPEPSTRTCVDAA